MTPDFSNFPIAFRFENERRTKVDLGGLLFPWLELVRMNKTSDRSMIVQSIKTLNYTACTSDLISDPYILSQVNGWSCIDWKGDDNQLGGNWDALSQYAYYFKITIFYCKYDGKSYTNCTEYNTLNNLLNGKTKIYLSLSIPSVSTTPSDFDRPLQTTTTNVFFTLNPLLMRTERYYYKNVTVNQDIGWFAESFRSFTGFNLDKRDIDLQIRTVEDYNDPTKIKTIATAVFIYSNKLEQVEVSFSKIQTFAANVGGVLKLFMETFSMMSFFYGTQTLYYDIINSLSLSAFQEVGAMDESKISLNLYKNLENENEKSEVSNPNTKNEISVSTDLNKIKYQNFMNNSSNNLKRKKTALEMIKKSTRKFLGPYEYFKNKMCCKKNSALMMFYEIQEQRIQKKFDILYYLQFSNSYDILSSLVLSKAQNLCLKNMSKLGNFSDDHIMFGPMTRDEQMTLDSFLKTEDTTTDEMDKKILELYAKMIN